MAKEKAHESEEVQNSMKALPLSGILIVITLALWMGYLSAKVFSLDRQLNNHYHTITGNVDKLSAGVASLEKDMGAIREQLNKLPSLIGDHIRQDVREEIRNEMAASRQGKPSSN